MAFPIAHYLTEAWTLLCVILQLCIILISVESTGHRILQYLQRWKKNQINSEHDDFLVDRLLWYVARTNLRLLLAFSEQLWMVQGLFWAQEMSTDLWNCSII